MKKGYLYLTVLIIVGIIISGLITILAFKTSFSELLYELFIAVFTGCIFAVPSGIIILCENISQNRKAFMGILGRLEKTVDYFTSNAFTANNVYLFLQNIVDIDNILSEIMRTNQFMSNQKKKIEELREELFVICEIIRKKHVNVVFDDLKAQMDDVKACISYIRDNY